MDRRIATVKGLLFAACLLPLGYYAQGLWQDSLGANPIEVVTRGLGTWTLNFLLITLTVTPLRRLSGWNWLLRLRRMLGLFTFFYASLHLTTYVWFDQFFDWMAIAKDIVKRPFITAGMVAFLLLIPLAATSSNAAIRRLGGRRWQALHRAVYPIAMIAVLHFWWLVKADTSQPAIYGAILVVLLGMRVLWRYEEKQRQLAGAYARGRGRVIPVIPRP